MKILVISDLHANWPALEAVLAAESFDRLFVIGDLVSYGPHPREVGDYVRAHAALVVRGNHDNALALGVDCRCAPSSKPLAETTRAVHRVLLSAEQQRWLGRLPFTSSVVEDGRAFYAVHASPRNHLFRYTLVPAASDEHVRRQVSHVRADYVLLGHTHFPMLRPSGRGLVLNPGSVGQPRDGDPRAAYALVEDGVATLKRAAYDVERTVGDLKRLPLEGRIVDQLAAILRTGGRVGGDR
jgi:predicted phosphodiesterase